MDGNSSVIMCERESSDAAGAYPITPSTQMGEYWAEETANGHINISNRPLIFIEPEGEHAAAAVTAGLSMTGLRATNFSSGQGIAYMHESLYAAVGKRLTYVLNMGCRAMTKSSLNVHAGHDDYHAVDDTGFFQVFGKSAQEVCDLNIIAHKIAELSLTPGIVAQDGFLTTHLIESIMLPERDLIAEYLGKPEDIIPSPTPAQRLMYGETRRRIPELWTVDNPMQAGTVQNQDAYMQSVAAQRPFFFDHIQELADQCFAEFSALTGRPYARVNTYRCEDADYIILGQGSVVSSAEAVVDYIRETRKIKVGVVNLIMFRPFPTDRISELLRGRKGVVVLERVDQPLASDLPLMKEVRSAVSKALENGLAGKGPLPHPGAATYKSLSDAPPLYSGSFGLGSRDLQPEGLIAAIENMLPDGGKKRFFYLSVDFLHDKAYTPKQEIQQQAIQAAYPNIKDLAIRGSENPNLMPKNAITVRFHSVGGWGAITTGKNLAMTLFDLLGYHIKANPKYGSEKKGQPTTYYLSAAPEPIRMNCEYFYVDVVLSPDPNVFNHSNAVAGLKDGGVFIIQSDLPTPEAVWKSIPKTYQKIIVDHKYRVFYLDAFKIAREEAADPELQFRMQGNAFQGAFFKASPVMEKQGLNEESLFDAIKKQLQYKFGAKGARVVEDNIRVVTRGFDEVREITEKTISEASEVALRRDPVLPVMMRDVPRGDDKFSDVHRFWEETGEFYMTGKGNDNLVDPFIGISVVPACTGVFRDMSQIRFEHPLWIPENCTACGSCYTVCPDSAIPGLVHSLKEVFDTAIQRAERAHGATKHLRKTAGVVENRLRGRLNAEGEAAPVRALLAEVMDDVAAVATVPEGERQRFEEELVWFSDALGDFQFSITKPYFTTKEKQQPGSGGLLSITVNPYGCKGCMECVKVCEDDALRPVTQTDSSLQKLRDDWDVWRALPTTSQEYIRIDDLNEKIGALETLLLDKKAYFTMTGGDGACLGCGEKTVLHLFTATVEALMQPRVKAQLARIEGLMKDLEQHVRLKLASTVDLSNPQAVQHAIDSAKNTDLTLGRLSEGLDAVHAQEPLDPGWLQWVTGLMAQLKQLHWKYTTGVTRQGRSSMGIINATGCTSVWGSTFPFNPYPFPWTNHLFQDSPSMAMGIFEGHMAKMADGFKAIRLAEMALADKMPWREFEKTLTYFNWRNFTDEEFLLCPPVVSVGGDGAMYDIGFQNLSRLMMSGKPVKVMVLDTQVYSNTGGQACTSGFTGQISDMAQYGKAFQGKEEIRKEIGLIAMAHRTTYCLQGSISNVTHLLEGFIDGLNTRRPALFNVYSPCMPEHGIGDDVAELQSKLAVESRAYPLFRYNPDLGVAPQECFDLEGNPALEADWPSYTIHYTNEEGEPAALEVPLTFADFAVTEGRFRKQFRKAPRDTWNENMVPLAEFVELAPEDREGLFPYIWMVGKKNELMRVIPAEPIVKATEDRKHFWTMLKAIALAPAAPDREAIAATVRTEMAHNLAAQLLQLAGGDGGSVTAAVMHATAAPTGDPGAAQAASGNGSAAGGFTAAYIDTAECTACDECININPKIFAYNESKKAYIKDPKGGPFKDIVRAAEKCTAQVIHPGTPANPGEPGLDKLVKRAEKFN
ncbi:MAG: 2-oxoacid:acceptor oxidoreductase family protein [Candidatus Hydrogenedentes bacterium]|nr:2-oxoacid:acceptor oxidoreductase family protein [Candidatus Hydrogenedentota bacterium]